MQQRRGLAAQWTAANPVLAAGEIGFETDSNKFKIGDGTNTWSLLKYFINLDGLDIDIDGFIKDDKKGVANGVASLDASGFLPTAQLPDAYLTEKINTKLAEVVGAAPATLNTLNEIAAAFNNDPSYANNMTAALDLKAPKASPTFTGTVTVPSEPSSDISTKAASTSHVTAKVDAAKTTLQTEINTVRDTLETALTTATGTISTALGTVNSNIAALQTEVTVTIEGRLDTIDTALGTSSTDATSLANRVSATESDISTAETNITTLNTIATATDASVVVLQGRATALETAVDALETEVGGVGVVTSRVDSAESDIQTLTASTDALDVRLDNHDTTITSLQTSASTLETALDAAEAKINTAEADIIALETKATTGETHIAATTSVHGIADTAALATKSYADSAKTDAITTSATAIALKADIASPTFTGVPSAPTATAGTSTTQVATTAFVGTAVSALVASAPAALDTLNELATALGNDANFSTTLTTNLGLKAPKADPTFTGTVALPAASSVTLNGTALSTTLATKADNNSAINVMSGAHTIVVADVNNIREMSGGGTITIPADNSFWPVGAVVDVIQTGSSQVTVAGGAGVTVNATPGLKIRAQWSSATILKRAANTFVVMGDLSA